MSLPIGLFVVSKNNLEQSGSRAEAQRTRLRDLSCNLINRTHKGFYHER